MLGHRIIGEGINPGFYFQTLIENHRFAELIEVIESRWPSLDDFSGNWPGRSGYGYFSMGFIANAYRETGNQEMFKDAMHRLKASLNAQLSEGANNWVLSWSQAHYAVLAGDYEAASQCTLGLFVVLFVVGCFLFGCVVDCRLFVGLC